jgi:hypothetical protein
MIKSLYNATKGGSLSVNTQVRLPQSGICLFLLTCEKPHAGRSILNNMLSITFGFRTNSPNHPLVGRALEMSREFMFVSNSSSRRLANSIR